MEKASEQSSSDVIEVSESISSQIQTWFSYTSLQENHEEKFSDWENYKKIMEQKVGDLEAFNAKVFSENNKLKETIIQKEDSIAKLQEDVRTRQRIIDDHAQTISSLLEKQEKLQLSLHEKDAQISEFEREQTSIQSSLNENNPSAPAIKEDLHLQLRIQVLSKKVLELEAELERRKEISYNMHNELTKLMAEITPLEAQILKVKRSLKGMITPVDTFAGSFDNSENVERVQYLGPAKLPYKRYPASCNSTETLVTNKFVPKSTLKFRKCKESNDILVIESPNRNVQRTFKLTPSTTFLRGGNHVKNILQTMHTQQSPAEATKIPKDSNATPGTRHSATSSTTIAANQNPNFMNIMKVLEKKFGFLKEQKTEIKNVSHREEKVNDNVQPCVQVTKPDSKEDTDLLVDDTLNNPEL